ncbi:uncharacterized protein [Argopecten irradians]|uniref:uncharacterized protein n=1 Tax=Argopecten irradians TaxID=31199 RepID=UPI00371799BC
MTFAMLVSLFLVVCFSVTYGNHFLSSQNVSWEEARTLCDMVVPPVNNNGSLVSDVPIDTETVTTTLAWVGRYISTSGWIQFEGCFNTAEAFINMTFDLTPSDANRVWTCHNLCPGNHFGITMTTCYCYTSSSRYTDIARVCGDNYRNESTGGFHGVDGCVLCIAVLVVSVTCTLKHTHPKRIPDQSHSHGADDGHEYHEIDVSTTGRMHAETLGIYNILHEPAPLDSHSTHSVYDHVQNPDYDEVSRMCKFSINPDPGDYDRVEDIRK